MHVSTEPLAARLKSFNSQVRVIPNALDAQLWRLSAPRQHEQGPFRRLLDGPVRIGYIGTPTHDGDLDLVTEAMRAIEAKYGPGVEIEVIGGFQKRQPTFGKRVGLPKKNDYPNFVNWLHERVHWDIGIIPLAANSFNESKSYLKFLEYAALDMAIVVSDVPAYRPVAKHGHNCLVSRASTADWIEKLTLLIEDRNLRNRLALNARSECAKIHTLDNIAPRLLRTLNALMSEQETV